MASCTENKQGSPDGLAIVPYCPVVFDVEPMSTDVNSSVPVHLTSTYEENEVNNNIILEPIPISQYEPDTLTSKKRRLKSSKVIDISYNNRFTRRVFQGNHIVYTWERDDPKYPRIENGGFKHELLENWVVESRLRQDGHTRERYFTHAKVKSQFRSIKLVQKFLASEIDGPNRQAIEKEARKNEVERFLAESYENLVNYYADES